MIEGEILALLGVVASVAFIHALLGPDHFLPFVALSRSRNWSMIKTAAVTAGCGLGHALGSIILGLIGVVAGTALSRLQLVEGLRGDLAAWILVAFGILYGVWGLRRAVRRASHSHWHVHADGSAHEHHHDHKSAHLHPHVASASPYKSAPWAIFIIFLLGPCEPLIPLMMLPAASANWMGLLLVTGVFTLVTVLTMVATVVLLTLSVRAVATTGPMQGIQRYGHAMAGGTMALGGVAVLGLGL